MAFKQQQEPAIAFSDEASEFRPEHGKKLAQRLAEQIEKDIVGAGWPVGRSLGREADLLARYPVSRAVLREAIAIVEQDGIVQMRRGVRGGLFVMAPAEQTVVLALRNFLEAVGVDIDELQFAYNAIEGLMLQLAARKLNPASMEHLCQLDAQMRQGKQSLVFARELFETIAATAENPVLSVFVAVLAQLGVSLTRFHDVSDRQVAEYVQTAMASRHAQIQALIANDLAGLLATLPVQDASLRALHAGAAQRRRKGLGLSREKDERVMQRLLEMGEVNRKVKIADVVALQLQAEIIRRGWQVGERLGSEAELIETLGVSRGAFREAVRALERLGAVRTVSGRHGGGLYVAAPDPTQTIRRTLLYFGHRQLSMEAIAEVDETISLAAITALAGVVANKGPSCLDALRRANAQTDGLSVELFARNGYLCIAEACGNRVLSLFMRIISGLTALRASDVSTDAADNARKLKKLAATQAKMISALENGDASVARRWMIELRKQLVQEHPVSRSVQELV